MANDLEILIRAKNLSQEAFDQLKQQIEAAGGAVQQFNTGMGNAAAGGAAFGAAAGAASLAVEKLTEMAAEAYIAVLDLVTGYVSAASAIDDLRLKTDVSAQALQEWGFVGATVGVSAETIGNGIFQMAKRIEEGSDKTVEALQKLGISMETIRSLSPEEQFSRIAAAIRENNTPASEMAALFGRNSELMKVVRTDAEALREKFRELGIAMSDDMVASGDKLGDSVTLLDKQWEGLKNRLGDYIVKGTEANRVVDGLSIVLAKITTSGDGAATGVGKFTDKIPGMVVAAIPGVAVLKQLADLLAQISKTSEKPRPAVDPLSNWAAEQERARIEMEKANKEYDEGAKARAAEAKRLAKETAAERLRIEKELQKDLGDAEKFKWAESKKENADYLKDWEAGTKKQEADNKAAADKYLSGWKASIDGVKDAWQNLFDYLDGLEEEERNQREQEIADLRDLGGVIGAVSGLYQAMGGSATSAFGQVLAGAEAGIQAMVAYKEATTNAQKATVILGAATAAYQSGSFLGGATTGAMTGAAIGSVVPGLGTAAGAVIGGIVGGLLGIAGGAKKAREEMEKLYQQFLQSVGGMDALKNKAGEAGISLQKLFDAKKPEELAKAINDIKKGLDSWAAAEQKTLAAMQKYGITIDQMGQSFAQLELNKQFADLYESYRLLTGAGADVALVNERMADDINKYIQDCLRAGVEIPAAMRPILQSLLDQGLLFDAAGNKMTSLDGLTFGESVSAQVQQIVDAVQQLVDALQQALGLGNQLGNLFGNTGTINPGGGQFIDPTPKPTAGGGWFPYQPGGYIRRIGEAGNEAVLNEPQLQGLMGQAVAMALSSLKGDSYQGGAGTVTIPVSVQIDGREVGRTVSKSSRRRQTKVQYGGLRGRP